MEITAKNGYEPNGQLRMFVTAARNEAVSSFNRDCHAALAMTIAKKTAKNGLFWWVHD